MPKSIRRSIVAPPASIRSQYESLGVDGFYEAAGDNYRNPHEEAIEDLLPRIAAEWKLDLTNVLDLAAGSGEVTLVLRKLRAGTITAIDPFTHRAYKQRTGSSAEPLTFAQIAAGELRGRRYSLIVCSFALHLCEPSRLPTVAQELSFMAPALLLIMPHKRPVLRPAWGWTLTNELVMKRVRARLFSTTGFQPVPTAQE